MLGIVRIALTRPYTFVVLALTILIFGAMSAIRTPTDIFPEINIPVIAVAWQFTGMTPDQMAAWHKAVAPSEAAWAASVKKTGADPKQVMDSLKANLAKYKAAL